MTKNEAGPPEGETRLFNHASLVRLLPIRLLASNVAARTVRLAMVLRVPLLDLHPVSRGRCCILGDARLSTLPGGRFALIEFAAGHALVDPLLLLPPGVNVGRRGPGEHRRSQDRRHPRYKHDARDHSERLVSYGFHK